MNNIKKSQWPQPHHINILLQELTRVNTEAACVCLTSLIEGLESVHQSEWLDVISQDVSKLKNSASLLHNRAVSFMTFLNIMVRTLISN